MDKSKVLKQLKLIPDAEKQKSWDAKETPEAAQQKATKALEDAKAYVDEHGFTLEAATATKLGGVKIGTGISVTEDGTISTSELSWDNITNKPKQFTPSTHTHQATQVTEDDTHKFVTNDEKTKIAKIFPFEDRIIANANEHKSSGFVKTNINTTNLPAECTENKDKWGILQFMRESNDAVTGIQVFYPVDGRHKGRIFTRAFCTNTWSKWHLASTFDGNYNNLSNKPSVDESLNKQSLNAVQNKAVATEIEKMKKDIGDLLYKPMTINSFTNTVNTVEMGTTVETITFNWTLNKTPKTLKFDEESITVSDKTKTLSGQTIKADKTFTLKAIDERDHAVTKTTGITFLNGIYWGVAVTESNIDNEFLKGLTKKLQGGKATTFTVNAGQGQNIFYAVPSRYGSCGFNVGGFDGGFTKVKTFNFTNASGYAENYDVYKSDNTNLGNTTVKVS